MMNATKKMIAFIIALIQLLVLAPVGVTAETMSKGEILFKYTGDASDDSKWAWQTGVYDVTSVTGSDGNTLWVNNGETYAHINQNQPIENGNVVISYDLRTEVANGYAYIINAIDEAAFMSPSVNSSSGRIGSVLYNGTYMGLTTSANNLKIESFEGKPVPKVWQHFDIWMNFDNHTIELYIDGKLLSEQPMNPYFTSFYGFGFVSNKDSNSYYMDNVYIGYVPTGAKADFDSCMATTPEAAVACYAEVIYEPVGHIYTDTHVDIAVELENIADVKNELSYEYKAITNTGHIIHSEQKNLVLEPKEKKTVNIEFDATEYGFYDSFFTIMDSKSGNKAERNSRFSVVKTRDDGKKSRIIGLCSHYQVNRGTEEVDRLQKLFADIGIMETREGVPWAQYEADLGSYSLKSQHLAEFNAFKENGQNHLFILGAGHSKRGITVASEDLDAWKEYVENVVQDIAPYGVKDFEVINEVDLKWAAGKLTAEDYVNVLKVTYPIVHKYIPDARVFAFSCARNYSNFIEACLAIDGCIENFDGISYHPYDNRSRPEEDNGSTTENSFHEYIAEIDGLVEKWGLQDKALIISEFGYTSSANYMTEDDQANWVVRASCYAYDHVEYIDWFMNLEKIDQREQSDAEYHFGWLRPWTKAEILYEAKPVIPAVAQYTSMITRETQSLGNQEILDGKGRLYRYKNDDKDVFMAWTVRGEEDFALDIGTEEATVYDRFGNAHIQKTNNGILYLRLSEKPQYIEGIFNKCEEKDEKGFVIEGECLNVIYGDGLKIEVENNTGNDTEYSVNVQLPAGVEVLNNTGFKNDICTVECKVTDDFENGSFADVSVIDKNENIVWKRTVPIDLVSSAETNFEIQYIRSGRWKGALKITNTTSKPIYGKLNIISPKELADKIPPVKIAETVPEMTRLVEFNIPMEFTADYIDLQCEVELNNGEKIPLEKSSYFTALVPIKGSPVIDGIIEKNEYNTTAPLNINKPRMVTGVNGLAGGFDWNGPNDLSAKAYINYDKDYFYFAMEAEDDILGSNDAKKRIWANDSVQFSFAERKEETAGFTEIGIGFIANEPSIERYSYMGEKENIIYHDAIGKKDGFEEDMEFMITRRGTTTTYELKIPWVDIYPTKDPFSKNNVFFALIVNENDLNGREGWMEFSPGIGVGKSAAKFTSVMVINN